MSEHRGETRTLETSDRYVGLARALADMVTGTAFFRVTPRGAANVWPHAHARAYNAAGDPIELDRATAITIAHWIMRAYSDACWSEPHDLRLGTARLVPSHLAGYVADSPDGSR